MTKRLLPLLLLLMSFLGGQSAFAQETGIQGLVQDFLNQQLGYQATLIEFQFEGRLWPDSSLGCPQEGETYNQEAVNGYLWRFLMGDGIRYAIHTDLFGQQIILCPQTSEAVLTYSTYNTTFFAIQHPNTWTTSQISPTEVSFNYRGQSACYLPEMRVLTLTNLTDSASILDAYFTSLGITPDRNDYVPILDKGLTVQHTLDCGGILRQYQATGVTSSTNAAFLILQSAPSHLFELWSAPFVEMVGSFVAGASPVGGSGASITSVQPPTPTAVVAQATPTSSLPDPVTAITAPTILPSSTPTPVPLQPFPPLVPEFDLSLVPLAHVFIGDVYVGRSNRLPGIRLTRLEGVRSHLRVSRDGQQLSYIEDGSKVFTVSMTVPENPNELAENAFGLFPPAWGFDMASLAYLSKNDDVLAIEIINSDATQETVGELPFRNNCEISSNYVIDQLYWGETGVNGNGLVFEWLAGNRFLYSTGCDGIGLAVFDKGTGEITPLEGDLRRASLSADRSKLVALNAENTLVLVDLSTLTAQPLTTSSLPDQLGWDTTGTQIFYSTLFPSDSLNLDDPNSEANTLATLGIFPYESRLNNVRIFQLDVVNGLEKQLWEGTGFAVGQLRGSPDGKGLLFSLVPSDRGLLTNFINQAAPNIIRNSLPETELYWLPSITQTQLEAGGARLLAFSAQPIWGAPPLPEAIEGTPSQ